MFEQIVRPFQSPNGISNEKIVTISEKVVVDTPILTWGEAGQPPTPESLNIKVEDVTKVYTETSRQTTDVRIENPDDSTQFVVAQRIDKLTFKAKPGDSVKTPGSSGGSGGVDKNTAYAPSPPVTNPTINTPVTQEQAGAPAADEKHEFTLKHE